MDVFRGRCWVRSRSVDDRQTFAGPVVLVVVGGYFVQWRKNRGVSADAVADVSCRGAAAEVLEEDAPETSVEEEVHEKVDGRVHHHADVTCSPGGMAGKF